MKHTVKETKILIRQNTKTDHSLFGSLPDDAVLSFTVCADGLSFARMILHCDGLSSPCGEVYREYDLSKSDSGFTVTLSADELKSISASGLYYYKYILSFPDGCDEYGGEGITLLERVADAGERQLLMYSHTFRTPDFLKNGLIYHIFVDRFASSGRCSPSEGSRVNNNWENGVPEYPPYPGARFDNREFFGGDLYGITEKLPYISSLGVTCIYLSPIFLSVSNHKYDTADYSRVDPAFGGEKALCALIKEAKKYGISVMLDGVFNHTGDDSVYFNRYGTYPETGAYQSKNSPFFDWYYFSDFPDRYESWWGVDILPKVNCDDPSYRDYILGENGIIEKYMKLGVAGFRLDVADELSEGFLEELRRAVRRTDPDGIVLGEVWEDASDKISYSKRRHYFNGFELDSVMNYPVRNGVIDYVKNGNAQFLRSVTESIYRRYPKCVSDCLMNFLGTHDTVRILTALAGKPSDGRSNDELASMSLTDVEKASGIRMLKVAYTVLAFLYGVPSVFYGDEAGLEGYGDPFCRKPYPWGNECKNLVEFYQKIGSVRRNETVLAEGLFSVDTADGGTFAYRRHNGTVTVTVVSNTGADTVCYECPDGIDVLVKTQEDVHIENKNVILPPMSAVVFKKTRCE